MFDITILTIFIPTIFVASITPSICMTLALSLGVKVGFRRTLWMIAGELVGVSGYRFWIYTFGLYRSLCRIFIRKEITSF